MSKRSRTLFLVSILVLGVTNVPFFYYRFSTDPEVLAGMYGLFAITTKEDYEIMLWIRSKISDDAVILVNPYEAGLFIPAVSWRKTVFPYGALQLTAGYQELVRLLNQNVVNVTAYELMSQYNITHIFVGSYSTYWWIKNTKWNPKIFLGNPNFQLLKRSGDSYLFELSPSDPKCVLLEEFNCKNLSDTGWASSGKGDGIGRAAVASRNSESYLALNSTRISNKSFDSSYFFEFIVHREVYLWETSNVTFSFHITSTSGFNDIDALAIVILNRSFKQSITIATPSGVFQLLDPNNTRTFTMEDFTGDFEFNLSKLWRDVYADTLPNEFYLQIRSFDLDGVTNEALIDSIKISY